MSDFYHKAPEFKTIDKIDFLPVEKTSLDNGVPVFTLRAGSQDVTKLDIQFPAGAVQAGIPLVASTTANLMQEGTKGKTSMQISEMIDFFGAYINSQTYHHQTIFTVLCLTRHLPEMLELIHDIITRPAFPEHEYDLYLKKKKEEFIFEGEKVKTIATRQFGETIFGADHPYGRQLKEEHFEKISLDQIKDFHRSQYQPEHAKIFVAGQPGDQLQPLLNKYFGKGQAVKTDDNEMVPPVMPASGKFISIKKDNAMQTALRIGRPLFNNHHPDFIPLQVLNTILGGYFGSRLMTSVREEKGLTYGIGSFIMPLMHSGVWGISSEVAGESRDKAIEAIFGEFDKLRSTPVPEDELQMVKNYMMGEMLRNFDGPFSTADIYRTLQEYGMDFDFYQKMIDYIREVSAEEIRKTAERYLRREDFWIVAAGM
ncbi:M16 family metallopeptidase [Marinilabilia rubra]|uniref:Insulinase family protein n=1 Tax=Marinilabilia rubra TaxID=2162893 RepID=A0A2U2B9P7_9BACT|nr:pitrilysin family protein [Marinilabilia rubra]PWD99788.1 insulinase family protein [Marinilabilia rubra]